MDSSQDLSPVSLEDLPSEVNNDFIEKKQKFINDENFSDPSSNISES